MLRRLPVFGCLALAPVLVLRLTSPPDPLPAFPKLMLWAWESQQDLRFIKPGDAGIAFLERTVWLDGPRVRSRPRMQPLRFTPGTDLMAVVRIESAGNGLPPLEPVIAEVMKAVRIPDLRALQIDFDARQSEHAWYASFLTGLRRALPANLPLTITALENWCEEAAWVGSLPVADATPMLFRMGPGDRPSPNSFPAGICRSSAGVSTDELPVHLPPARRIYFFHPGPWTPQVYDVAVAQAARWRR